MGQGEQASQWPGLEDRGPKCTNQARRPSSSWPANSVARDLTGWKEVEAFTGTTRTPKRTKGKKTRSAELEADHDGKSDLVRTVRVAKIRTRAGAGDDDCLVLLEHLLIASQLLRAS